MTPHELAEKIHDILHGDMSAFDYAKIESLLSAALEETVNNERKNVYVSSADGDRVVRMITEAKAAGYSEGFAYAEGVAFKEGQKVGKSVAYEDAAKIAEDHDCQDPYACHAGQQAEKLRAKAVEVGK